LVVMEYMLHGNLYTTSLVSKITKSVGGGPEPQKDFKGISCSLLVIRQTVSKYKHSVKFSETL